MSGSLLSRLSALELLVVTGKGGVGKTTVAAALGSALASRGRRVLLLEVDARESCHQVLGAEPSGGAVVRVSEGLSFQNVRPAAVVDSLVLQRVRIPGLARRVFRSPVYRHFADGAPGMKELATLGHALTVLEERPAPERPDLVILDSPATGHGVSLLTAPRLVSEAIERGPVARLTGRVAALVGDPGRTGVLVVTMAEEMPVTEALEMAGALERRVGRLPELVIVNALYPPLPVGFRSDSEGKELWARRRVLNDRQLARLEAGWPGPLATLPLLPAGRGAALNEALAARLSASLVGVAA